MPSRSRSTASRVCDRMRRRSGVAGIRRVVRRASSVVLAIVIVVATAGPAFADPAAPTNYQSVVTAVDPPADGVEFEVVGGDAFLQVTVLPGHEVLIPGYFNEPYVRIDGDGSVWVNEGSPAYYINRDRYGEVPVPDDVDAEGEPQWTLVADGGRYAWHDHRTHWMSADLPPAVSGATVEVVFPWEIPVVIDGRDTTVRGELLWVPSQTPVPALLAGIIALLPLLAWRRGRTAILAGLTVAAAGVAVALTVVQNNGTPAAVRGFPTLVVIPLVALLAALAALVMRTRPQIPARLTLLGGLSLVAWAVAAVEVLWLPMLPSAIPSQLERAGVAFVLWAGVGVVVLSVTTLIVAARALRPDAKPSPRRP